MLLYGLLVLVLHPTVTQYKKGRLLDFLRYIDRELDACQQEADDLAGALNGFRVENWSNHFLALSQRYRSDKLSKVLGRVNLLDIRAQRT